VADFTSRILLPNNDDGDLTYYKRRGTKDLLPLIGGTGQVTQAAQPARAPQRGARVLTTMPSAEPGPNGFPVIQFVDGKLPAALGLPNTSVQAILEGAPARGGDVFQREWIDACKGKNGGAVHGTSTKTHCDFDYAGSMMEQMLLGLVAHRAGKKLEYDAAAGRIKNMEEANAYLRRDYRPNWTLNG
jgi:hypothetical protein